MSKVRKDFLTPGDSSANEMFYMEYVEAAIKRAYLAGIKATASCEGLNGVYHIDPLFTRR